MSPNPDAFVDPEMLAVGKYWSMGAPLVSESYSKGNRSNTMGPGQMTSQLEFHRYSKEIAGNLANVVTEYELKVVMAVRTNFGLTKRCDNLTLLCVSLMKSVFGWLNITVMLMVRLV